MYLYLSLLCALSLFLVDEFKLKLCIMYHKYNIKNVTLYNIMLPSYQDINSVLCQTPNPHPW